MDLSASNIYKQELNNLFSQAPVNIRIIRAKDYVVEFSNNYYSDPVGKKMDIVGKSLFEVFPELIHQGIKTIIDQVFETGVPYIGKEFPINITTNSGEEKHYFDFVYNSIRENGSTITKLILVTNEVTEQVISRKKMENQAKMVENLLINAPAFICTLVGPTHVYGLVNARYQSLFGKRLIQGKPIMEALPELEGQGFDLILDNVYETGEIFLGIDIPIILARDENLDPEERFFNFSYQPMYDENNAIYSILVFGYEVTPQALINKKIKESEMHFRTIAELMPEKVNNATPEGEVFFYNKIWCDYTGVSMEELVTEGWGKWIHPDDLNDTYKNWCRSVEMGSDFDMELRILNHQGDYHWHTSRAIPVKDEQGNVKMWIGSNVDIQDQKQQTIDLAVAVAERTAELQKINDELQRKNQEIALSMYNKRFLIEFSERFSGNKLSNEFFDSVVQFIADTTGVDYVFIGKLHANGKNKTKVHTIAITAFGTITDNIVYPLSDSPCAEVISNTTYSYPENCKNIFPLNQTLIKYNIEGYVGLPLFDTDGKAMALIAVMCQRKIKDPETIFSILRIVAKRVEIEFERIRHEEILEENIKLLNKKNIALKKSNVQLNSKNKEITETREKLLSEYSRSLIEASLDPLFVISPKGKITDMNQAAIKVTNVVRQKLTGTNFYDYFTDSKNAREVYKEVFLKGFVTDYPLTIKDNFFTDVLFNGSVYKDDQGNVLGAVVVARDITEQKKVEQQLFDSKVIAEQSSAFAKEAKEIAENAQQVAESAVKSKQQFLSNMSHEIRTPMNAIIGFTKVMLKTNLSEKQREYLSAIESSGDALIVLINDILDLAKIEAGKMSFEQVPFKLASTIALTHHLFEPKIQEKNIELIKEYDERIPEVLLGDPVRLNQVMLNLLSNAVKFTTVGKIIISVCLVDEDKKKVTINFSIKDTGIGIKEENLNTIFENFQQASNETTRLYGGTGLGLSIVKQLLEPQGGHISVKSVFNEGSTFSFTLTFLKTKAMIESIPEILQLDTEMKEIKVLVAEDMALNQLLMRTLLDDFGFVSDIAANGKLAIEKMKNKQYDIILMDLQMPEMNGFEATDYIRNTLKSSIPIIALTADVTTVDLGKCTQAGMNDYIAKPIDEKLLYSKIVNLIKKNIPKPTEDFLTDFSSEKVKCINLAYLNTRTKSNPVLIKEMIEIYLEQTPRLINLMKSSFHNQDWKALSSASHKIIPSFSIMGMHPDFEDIARKIQDLASTQLLSEDIAAMVVQLEKVCMQACLELEEELKNLT